MAHLTLQLGAAVVIPIRAPRKTASGRAHWRVRALSEPAAAAAALGFNWPAAILARAAARGARSEA
jgi:hypothetical protein